MRRPLHNTVFLRRYLVVVMVSILSLGAFAQTVTISPAGTTAKPNLIPVNNAVTFSINPIGFGACMNNLSYSWAILNSNKDTVYKSVASTPNYNFTKEDIYTISLTVKTLPGGSCTANITKSTASTIKVAKEGAKDGAPTPNVFSANTLGTLISAYNIDENGQIISGPYDHFDPFPADNAFTAALAMDDQGTYFYLPTFMNGPNPLTATQVKMGGVVEVWAVDKKANNPPVVIVRFDMNGSSTTELGLFRLGLDQKGNAWILAGDGANMYAASFKTNGTKVINTAEITAFPVPFESGSAADFQSGDLAFDNKGNMYVLAGSSTGTHIYTMSTNSSNAKLSKKWKVTDVAGKNFGLSVTGTVFDAKGNMFFSALDGLYFIDYDAVNAATATAVVKKTSDNFGLMDLATSQFPAAWTPPIVAPIVLASKVIQFSGAADEQVHLNWSVSSNETGSHFEVEKSYNGSSFKTQTLIFYTDRQGEEVYSFTEATPSSSIVYYRLKIVDINGKITYSKIIALELGDVNLNLTASVYPNPFSDNFKINIRSVKEGTITLRILSLFGQEMISEKVNIQPGQNTIVLSEVQKLTSGVHVLQLVTDKGAISQKIIKK